MKIQAKITYKVRPTHPDFLYKPDWCWKGKTFTYEDVYHFTNPDWTVEEAKGYIKSDLRLIASGGYRRDKIYDEEFEFKEVI